jgi:biopolymer transport protein ExbD
MHFFVRKRRQTPTVIIVALVDVLIVLLIFLMVTTTFKQQPALKLALPESSHAEKTSARDTVPLIISIDALGNLLFGDDKVPVTADSLKARLVDRVRKDPDVQVALNADKAAPFGKVVIVMDAAKEAKIKMVNAFMKEAAKP